MRDDLPYLLLADVVLALHFALVAFVVGGLVLIFVGNLRGWRWVNGWGFRLAHLVAIGVIVAQAWLGATCPLTTLEMWLREQGGGRHLPRELYRALATAANLLRSTVVGFYLGLHSVWPARRRNLVALSTDGQTRGVG